MASVTNKDIPEEYAFFGDLFIFRKKHYIVEDSEEYWQDVISDSNDLLKKHHDKEHYDFYKKLIFACIEDWENQRRRKERVN